MFSSLAVFGTKPAVLTNSEHFFHNRIVNVAFNKTICLDSKSVLSEPIVWPCVDRSCRPRSGNDMHIKICLLIFIKIFGHVKWWCKLELPSLDQRPSVSHWAHEINIGGLVGPGLRLGRLWINQRALQCHNTCLPSSEICRFPADLIEYLIINSYKRIQSRCDTLGDHRPHYYIHGMIISGHYSFHY